MDENQDRLSDLLTEFEKIDYSPDYKVENGTAIADKKRISDWMSFKSLKITGIYCSVFIIWSFIIVAIFSPSYVYVDNKFQWNKFFFLSFIVFLSLVILYQATKWVTGRFIK